MPTLVITLDLPPVGSALPTTVRVFYTNETGTYKGEIRQEHFASKLIECGLLKKAEDFQPAFVKEA